MDSKGKETELIVIDTDCGIDDAMAILLALGSSHAKVLAVTCCFGNTCLDNVCTNVMRVLALSDATHIPIYRGCSSSLIPQDGVSSVHGGDGLGNCAYEFPTDGKRIEQTPAALALLQLVQKYPKQITLLALGPLTNLAIAHRIDPEFSNNLKALVCMGGSYKGIGNVTETAEFNFYCDPEAAHIVFTETHCPKVLVPWETTLDYGIPWEEFEKLINVQNKKAYFLSKIAPFFADPSRGDECEKFYDCDVLAVVAALYPESIQSKINSRIAVECSGKYTRGLTILLRDQPAVDQNKSFHDSVDIITHFDCSALSEIRKKVVQM